MPRFGGERVRARQEQESPCLPCRCASLYLSRGPSLKLKQLIWFQPQAGQNNNSRWRGQELQLNAVHQSAATACPPQIASGPGSLEDRPSARSLGYSATRESNRQLHSLPKCG